MNVVNGGRHAQGAVEMQAFMMWPREEFGKRLKNWQRSIRKFKKLLTEKGFAGGFG